MVYEEVVVFGRIGFDFKREKKEPKKPLLSLLQVCKQIHAEAEPLYLGKNLFCLPDNWAEYQPFHMDLNERFPELFGARHFMFSTAGFQLIRIISFRFCTSQLGSLDLSDRWDNYEADYGAGSYYEMTEDCVWQREVEGRAQSCYWILRTVQSWCKGTFGDQVIKHLIH